MLKQRLQIRRLSYPLGAEVTGVDVSEPLDDATIAEIRNAWLEHSVLCFPNQDIGAKELSQFSARFGELDDNERTSDYRHPEDSTVQVLTSKPVVMNGQTKAGHAKGDLWHTDLSTSTRPATATVLLAKDLPDVGGNTMFTNQYLAYETLSPTMRSLIDQLSAVHTSTLGTGYKRMTPQEQEQYRRLSPPVVHPVARVHPETGRTTLYLGERVQNFVGMTEEESKPLIDFLNKHSTSYEFMYRHVWKVNDLVMWDNRCTMHYAVADYDRSQLRRMFRCALRGPVTGEFYTSPN